MYYIKRQIATYCDIAHAIDPALALDLTRARDLTLVHMNLLCLASF